MSKIGQICDRVVYCHLSVQKKPVCRFELNRHCQQEEYHWKCGSNQIRHCSEVVSSLLKNEQLIIIIQLKLVITISINRFKIKSFIGASGDSGCC